MTEDQTPTSPTVPSDLSDYVYNITRSQAFNLATQMILSDNLTCRKEILGTDDEEQTVDEFIFGLELLADIVQNSLVAKYRVEQTPHPAAAPAGTHAVPVAPVAPVQAATPITSGLEISAKHAGLPKVGPFTIKGVPTYIVDVRGKKVMNGGTYSASSPDFETSALQDGSINQRTGKPYRVGVERWYLHKRDGSINTDVVEKMSKAGFSFPDPSSPCSITAPVATPAAGTPTVAGPPPF